MHIKRIEINNFGALESAEIDLEPGINALAGVNGAGKSTFINAVHLMFLRYINAMRTGRIFGRGPSVRELRVGAKAVRLEVVAEHMGEQFQWSVERSFIGLHSRKTREDVKELRSFIRSQLEELETPETANISLFATYPVGRAVLDVPLRVRSKDATTQAAAFGNTALSSPRHFRSFFAWFRDKEDYENERRVEEANYRDRQLQAVRRAVERLMPGFADLRVRRKPLRMVVTKGGAEFEVNRLSDGEKGLLALAGDLARKLALCNPSRKNPLEGDGLVLIDEIELHLHPAWQRNVIHGLGSAFPNVQFIVTTHSPQVLSELPPEQISLLKDGVALSVKRSYGMDSTQVLRELMGDPGRPEAISRAISELYARLDAGDITESETHLRELERAMGRDDPALSLARAKVRRSKVLSDREAHPKG